MTTIFEDQIKKKLRPPEPSIYGFCLSDLSMENNKEGGNKTKMKRVKGGEEVSFVRQSTLQAEAKGRKWESVKKSWEKA